MKNKMLLLHISSPNRVSRLYDVSPSGFTTCRWVKVASYLYRRNSFYYRNTMLSNLVYYIDTFWLRSLLEITCSFYEYIVVNVSIQKWKKTRLTLAKRRREIDSRPVWKNLFHFQFREISGPRGHIDWKLMAHFFDRID